MVPPSSSSVNVSCVVCGEEICRLCKHPPHLGPCEFRQKLLLSFLHKNVKIMPCPYCLQLSSIVEGSLQTTCYFCKDNFCSLCSAKLSPILAHGAHYHRPSCELFKKESDLDRCLQNECSECAKVKIRCERPMNLAEGDIPNDEKPAGFK